MRQAIDVARASCGRSVTDVWLKSGAARNKLERPLRRKRLGKHFSRDFAI